MGQYRVNVHGIDIIANTPAEAIALAKEAAKSSAGGKPHKNGVDRLSAALGFLGTIRDAGSHGASTDQMLKVLGAKKGRGIGGVTKAINAHLTGLGFANPKSSVYKTHRTSKGRTWYAGPRLTEAIDLLNKQRGGIT